MFRKCTDVDEVTDLSASEVPHAKILLSLNQFSRALLTLDISFVILLRIILLNRDQNKEKRVGEVATKYWCLTKEGALQG